MCGVFGVVADPSQASRLAYLGLYALQHRGQEAAGIALVNEQGEFDFHKGMGLVSQVFNDNILSALQGSPCIGHVRYSTTGGSKLLNTQPIQVEFSDGKGVMLAHNGNLVNAESLRSSLESEGFKFKMTSDTEVIGALIAKYYNGDLVATMEQVAKLLRGAFSLLVMSSDKIIAMRDPYGIRPLCFGVLPNSGGYVVASESCALNIVGADLVREVASGELIVINRSEVRSIMYDQTKHNAHCIFEHIYFARPDSYLEGRNIYRVRENMGMQLWKEHPVEADIVIAVPDSGIPAAIGYAKASGITYEEGLIKNRYVGRTFIAPSQILREMGVRIKLNPLKEVLDGKRVVIIDDSIVRGTTSAKIVKLLKDSGAKEVHFRVSSPPNIAPCYYGIDTPDKDQLIAARESIENIRQALDAESLGYLSVEGLVKSVGLAHDQFCLGCLDEVYHAGQPGAVELRLIHP